MADKEKTNQLILRVQALKAQGVPSAELAEYVAREVHQGPESLDKNGIPYINHPRRVSNIVAALFSEHSELEANAYAAAWLHDVIEDSRKHFGEKVTKEDLLEMGFSFEVVSAVDLVSKEPGLVEVDYLERIAGNEIARIVKFADLTDNTSPLRRSGLTPQRRGKYGRYWDNLVVSDERAYKDFVTGIDSQVTDYKEHLVLLYFHSGYTIDFAVGLLKRFGAVNRS